MFSVNAAFFFDGREPLLVLGAQPGRLQEFRTVPPCLSQRRFPSPLPDLLVISTQQYFRRLPTFKLCRTGVVRAIKNAQTAVLRRLKGFLFSRCFVSQRSGQQTRHGIHDDSTSPFASTQHEIPNRHFLVGQMFRDSLIHSFVSSADQCDLVIRRQARRRTPDQTAFLAPTAERSLNAYPAATLQSPSTSGKQAQP